MIKNNNILFVFFLICLSCNPTSDTAIRADDYSAKADSILAIMTLEEKIGQLNLPGAGDINTGLAANTGIVLKIREGKVGALFNIRTAEKIRATQRVAVEESRLKIPLIFAMDVIHGYKTIFPIPLGLSCTWDMDMVKQSARIAAQEATADGICWTFSPMVDICRDPRWGRIAEGVGEDPYLGSAISRAMVEGYQGNDLSVSNTMMACVKHFALYGASEAGRDYNTTDMSHLRMYNDYFPPYKAAIDAGVGSVMASFNDVDGIPATGSRWLMTEVLRNQWGFDGWVVSDYTGVNEMIEHGMGDLQAVTSLALKAGIDMDMVGEGFLTTIQKSIEEGKLTEEQVSQACKRILMAKYQLGLFDDPYKYCDLSRAEKDIYTDENRTQSRKIGAASLVLLKNENDLLPIKKKGTIGLIGPLGNNRENISGTWSVAGDFEKAISLKMGLEEVGGEKVKVLYAKGANVYNDKTLEDRVSIFGKPTYRDNRTNKELLDEALRVARQSDVIVAALGEAAEMSGESSSRADITIPDSQQDLLKALLKTGKPVVLVLFTGRPLALKWEAENVPAILNVWFPGSEGGYAIADVLFGDVNPSGRLTTTFPQNIGQVPIYYNYKNTGRPLPEGEWFQKFRTNYLDVSNEPMFSFGFGLSYTTFDYGDIQSSKDSLITNDTLTLTIAITNTGSRSGKETIQLYIRDLVGSTTRPVKELKAFQQVILAPGEAKDIVFNLTTEDLKYYTYDQSKERQEIIYDWEPGDFEIMIGSSAKDVKSVLINWKNR